MKIYLLERTDSGGYDTYDSCIVIAENEYDAVRTDPGGLYKWCDDKLEWYGNYNCEGRPGHGDRYAVGPYPSWADIDKIKCTTIGEAYSGMTIGVVCSSFNAG